MHRCQVVSCLSPQNHNLLQQHEEEGCRVFIEPLSPSDLAENTENAFFISDVLHVCCGRLEVWPGYDCSILQFEKGPGLVVEIIHKMISIQTVYDVMGNIYERRAATFREECMREIVGQIVITRLTSCIGGLT